MQPTTKPCNSVLEQTIWPLYMVLVNGLIPYHSSFFTTVIFWMNFLARGPCCLQHCIEKSANRAFHYSILKMECQACIKWIQTHQPYFPLHTFGTEPEPMRPTQRLPSLPLYQSRAQQFFQTIFRSKLNCSETPCKQLQYGARSEIQFTSPVWSLIFGRYRQGHVLTLYIPWRRVWSIVCSPSQLHPLH